MALFRAATKRDSVSFIIIITIIILLLILEDFSH